MVLASPVSSAITPLESRHSAGWNGRWLREGDPNCPAGKTSPIRNNGLTKSYQHDMPSLPLKKVLFINPSFLLGVVCLGTRR